MREYGKQKETIMSDKHILTTIFEISIEDNKLLIDFHERDNTISEKIQYSIDMFLLRLI